MSKETITSVKDRVEFDENLSTPSAEDLDAQFDAPAFSGVRPNGERIEPLDDDNNNRYGLFDDGSYNLLSQHLVDSRMVIGGKPDVEAPLPASPEREQKVGRMRRLGRFALNTLKTVQNAYTNIVVKTISVMPGTATEEELHARNQAQKEKFADKPGDGFFTRKWNAIRRNKYEAMAWSPVAAMGLAAVEMYALRSAGYFNLATATESLPTPIPTHSLKWNEAIVTTPLPPVETHDVAPPQVAVIDTPAPTPTHTEAAKPIITKHVWTPKHDTAPVAGPTEKHVFKGKEIVVVTGGATDPTGDLATQQLIDNGTIDPTKVTIIKNQYPAEMAPFVGQQTTQQSTAIGAQNLRDIIAQNPDARITSYAFSEGNFPNDTVGAELYRAGNKNVNFVGYGSGNAASGLLNSPLAEMFRPIVDGFGILRTPPAAGTTMILDGSDGYASNAGGDIGKLLHDAVGPGHRIVGPNEPRVMTFDVNGVHYEVVGNAIPLPPGAILTSGTPAPGFGGLPEQRPQDLMPNGQPVNPGQPPIAQEQPPVAPESVRLSTPSFFGEQPCVAPDGSQYFTPGNAAC